MKKKIVTIVLSLIFLLSMGYPLSVLADENWAQKITPQLWEKLQEADNNDVIKVYLWTKDMDQEEIEERVYETTGYSRNNIQQAYETIDQDVRTLNTGSVTFKKSVLEHKEQTAEARAKEQAAISSYINEKRNCSRDAYNEMNTENIRKFGINTEKVYFSSQYSPMIIAELTANQIRNISASRTVTLIDLYVEKVAKDSSISSMLSNVKADRVRDLYGYSGSGVKIGQIEPSTTSDHAVNVRSIISAIAPDAVIESRSVSTVQTFYSQVEALITSGCTVINMSANYYENNGRISWYTNEEKWVDHIEGPHGISFVNSAGNDYTGTRLEISSPGMAYNVITVGAINDNNTTSTSDDTVQSYSAYVNNGSNGCAKPEIMAPDTLLSPADNNGTSYAAPVVTGVIAQLMEYKPYLKGNSRLVKAILVAGCDRKINEALDKNSSLTAIEGAGIINAVSSFSIMTTNSYRSGSFTSDELTFEVDLSKPITYVGLAWATISSVGSDHVNPTIISGTHVNLDVYMYNSSNTLLASGRMTHSSAEKIWESTPLGTYRFTIKRTNNANATVWYSLAWY